MADPYQLQQVVLNLVVNAEQALLEERGQGHVRIRTSHSARRPRPRTRRPNSARDLRRRPGIPADDRLAHLRPVLHHQAAGRGHGPRPFHRLRNRAAARRGSDVRKPAWRGSEIHGRAARRRRSGGRSRGGAVLFGLTAQEPFPPAAFSWSRTSPPSRS